MADSSFRLRRISKGLSPPVPLSRKWKRGTGFICLTICLLCTTQISIAQSPDGPEAITVYLTQEQALQKAFPKADTLWSEIWTPTQQERRRIERRLGWRVEEESFAVYQAQKDGVHRGFAVITNQIGLYKPITFIVKVKPDFKVDGVWIMVYRESRGSQVKRQRFLTQYKKKKVTSHIRLNRDIVGISGATLSVRALNAGVKRVLTVLDIAYSQKETQ